MAEIYAELIRKGLKTLEDVPEPLREEVQQILERKKVEGASYALDLIFFKDTPDFFAQSFRHIIKCFQPLSNQLGIHFRHIHQPPITSS